MKAKAPTEEIMTLLDVENQGDYVWDIYKGLAKARKAGRTLSEVSREFAFADRYRRLRHLSTEYPSLPLNLHERNFENVWAMLKGIQK